MDGSLRGAADIVMLGSFGIWTRGTLQSRALPFARRLAATTDLRFAIITTPWDDPSRAATTEIIDGVRIFNTRTIAPAAAPFAVLEQLRITQQLRPGIVHVMKPKAFAGLTALATHASASSTAMIVDHDDWEGDGGWNDAAGYNVTARRLFAFQERRLLESAHYVTAASTLLEGKARRMRTDRDRRDVTFLPNGLERAWLETLRQAGSKRSANRPPALVLYSRFAEFSPEWLARMLDAMDRSLSISVDLHIIGEASAFTDSVRHLHHLNPIWHGFVDRSEIPGLLQEATIALYPYQDNLINRSKQSVKLLELMAAGCAIVASDVGDVRRIGGESVRIAADGTPGSFARAVQGLITDCCATRALGDLAASRVELFTIERLAERLLDVYRRTGRIERLGVVTPS